MKRLIFASFFAFVSMYSHAQKQPNFKIRVGNFRSRLEAYKFMRSLAAAFSNSFIVNDEIVIPELGAKWEIAKVLIELVLK